MTSKCSFWICWVLQASLKDTLPDKLNKRGQRKHRGNEAGVTLLFAFSSVLGTALATELPAPFLRRRITLHTFFPISLFMEQQQQPSPAESTKVSESSAWHCFNSDLA